MSDHSKSAAVIVFVTASSASEAERIGDTLVQERLAACANILDGMLSIFIWKGKSSREKESLLILKTTRRCVSRLIGRVKELHSYEVPEIVAIPIVEGSGDYLRWISESTGEED